MARWEITATATDGRVFVYTAEGRTEMQAAMEAYGLHGQSLRSGEVDSPLTVPWVARQLS